MNTPALDGMYTILTLHRSSDLRHQWLVRQGIIIFAMPGTHICNAWQLIHNDDYKKKSAALTDTKHVVLAIVES